MILLGEYAVLEGAPALVTAVNRYAHVVLEENDEQNFRIESPTIGVEYTSFTVSPHGIICYDEQDKVKAAKARFDQAKQQAGEVKDLRPGLTRLAWDRTKGAVRLLKPEDRNVIDFRKALEDVKSDPATLRGLAVDVEADEKEIKQLERSGGSQARIAVLRKRIRES